jgi:Bifunctional DNA primase/polymerase, N-terminal
MYAAHGWPVLPLRPGGKEPLGALAPHGVKDATCDAGVVRSWWAQCPTANIGLACGVNCWVLDVDGEEGKATLAGLQARHGTLPPTVASLTGSGGWHLFFALPSGRVVRNSVRRLGPGLDTRSLGGYVVLPPSIHPSGRPYAFAPGTEPWAVGLASAPAWLLDLLDPPPPLRPIVVPAVGSFGLSGNGRYALAALRRGVERVARAATGARNETLNAEAFSLARFAATGELDREALFLSLAAAAEVAGLPRREIVATLKGALRAGETRHV